MRSATLVALFIMAVGFAVEPAYAGPTGTSCVKGQSVVRPGARSCAPRTAQPRVAPGRVVRVTRVASSNGIPPRPPPPPLYGSRSDTIPAPAYVPARTTRVVRTPARYVPPPPPPPAMPRSAQPVSRVVRTVPAPTTTYRAPAYSTAPPTYPVVRRPATATITYSSPAPRRAPARTATTRSRAPRRLITRTRPSASNPACNDKSPAKLLKGIFPSSCAT